jgi:hypothetical protein
MFAALVCHLRGVLTRRRAEHELDEELRFHVEMETQANMGRGLNEIEARRVALRDMGGVTQTKEAVHDLRGALVVERVFQDAKGALRRARREPGFAAAVIVTCGLAIGLATTIYAMAAGVLLHPLPFEKPEQLVQLWKTAPEWDRVAVSVPEFFEWNGEAYSFVALNAARDVAFRLVTSDGAKWAQGLSVTPGMFTMLGVRAQIGRTFLPAEDQPGHNRVVMLDEGFWRRAFAANPKVVGTRIRLLTDDSRFPGAIGIRLAATSTCLSPRSLLNGRHRRATGPPCGYSAACGQGSRSPRRKPRCKPSSRAAVLTSSGVCQAPRSG